MAVFSKNQKIGRNFLPFCAGIACGIFISVMLFFLFASKAMSGHVWVKTNQNVFIKNIEKKTSSQFDQLRQDVVVHERKLSQDNGKPEDEKQRIIPIEVQPIKDSSWDSNLNPPQIQSSLAKELNLKKKVFVAIIHPSGNVPSLFNAHHKTWAKDWVQNGKGDITFYAPMGVEVPEENSIKVQHLSASSQTTKEPSIVQLYQVLGDICSQHIDTHHHFFIANSNVYIHLRRLLNFTNHVDETLLLWLGKSRNTNENEKSFMNDPSTHCAVSPGLLVTRHLLQQLCPRMDVCEREYNQYDVSTGLQFSRCALRFLNETCIDSDMEDFHVTKSTDFKDLFSDESPYKDRITVSPVPDESSMLKLHYYYLLQQLNETQKENEHYYNIVKKMDQVLVRNKGMSDDRLILGKKGIENKYEHPDVITWEKVELGDGDQGTILSIDSPQPSRDVTDRDLVALNRVKNFALQQVKEEHGWTSDMSIKTVFRRVVPAYGFQYMVEVARKDEEMAVVYIDQPYDRLQTLSTVIAPDVTIHFILPLQDGSPHLKGFMQMFEQAAMSPGTSGNVALLLVLYFPAHQPGQPLAVSADSESVKLLNLYKQKYPNLSLRWIDAGSRSFSYIDGLSLAVGALPPDTLLCSTDLLAQISLMFFHHVRLNVVQGERLYFPSAFQQFHAEDFTTEDISSRTGFWKDSDFNLFCGYSQDIMRASGGKSFKSGADLYERAPAAGFDVFRCPEQALTIKRLLQDCKSDSLSAPERESCEEYSRRYNRSALT